MECGQKPKKRKKFKPMTEDAPTNATGPAIGARDMFLAPSFISQGNSEKAQHRHRRRLRLLRRMKKGH
jgi:hypothetical protein